MTDNGGSGTGSFHDESARYIERHGVRALMQQMLEALAQARPEDPIDFLCDHLGESPSPVVAGDGQAAQHSNSRSTELVLLHLADTATITASDTEPSGGAARFMTKLGEFERDRPLVFLSGGAFGPCSISTVTRGEHMASVLNECGISTAVLGKHDLDFGVDRFRELSRATNFPWLCSNAVDKGTGKPLAGCKAQRVFEWHGVTVGVMGLVEYGWLAGLTTLAEDQVGYTDYCEAGAALARSLRANGADLVVALTRMATASGERLAREVPDIDIVLGGHGQEAGSKKIGRTTVVSSGPGFGSFSALHTRVWRDRAGQAQTAVRVEPVLVTSDVEPDDRMRSRVAQHQGGISLAMEEVVGLCALPLDARRQTLRAGESSAGNMVCDAVRFATRADAVLLRAGSFSGDRVLPAGPLRLKNLVGLVPGNEGVVVLEATGKQLLHALEDGVARYPRLSDRFPQVSGLRFAFSPGREAGSRLVASSVKVGGEPLHVDATYRLATEASSARGEEAFAALADCREVVGPGDATPLPVLLRNHFAMLAALAGKDGADTSFQRAAQDFEATPEYKELGEGCAVRPRVDGRITVQGGAA